MIDFHNPGTITTLQGMHAATLAAHRAAWGTNVPQGELTLDQVPTRFPELSVTWETLTATLVKISVTNVRYNLVLELVATESLGEYYLFSLRDSQGIWLGSLEVNNTSATAFRTILVELPDDRGGVYSLVKYPNDSARTRVRYRQAQYEREWSDTDTEWKSAGYSLYPTYPRVNLISIRNRLTLFQALFKIRKSPGQRSYSHVLGMLSDPMEQTAPVDPQSSGSGYVLDPRYLL